MQKVDLLKEFDLFLTDKYESGDYTDEEIGKMFTPPLSPANIQKRAKALGLKKPSIYERAMLSIKRLEQNEKTRKQK